MTFNTAKSATFILMPFKSIRPEYTHPVVYFFLYFCYIAIIILLKLSAVGAMLYP